jgi:hypothetical protein
MRPVSHFTLGVIRGIVSLFPTFGSAFSLRASLFRLGVLALTRQGAWRPPPCTDFVRLCTRELMAHFLSFPEWTKDGFEASAKITSVTAKYRRCPSAASLPGLRASSVYLLSHRSGSTFLRLLPLRILRIR